MTNQVRRLLLMIGTFSILSGQAARADERITNSQAFSLRSVVQPSVSPSVANISRIRELQRPATTVKDWLAQVEAATVQVTSVRVDRTDFGLEITLETAEGKPLQVDATKFRSEGNSLIADIPNAVLSLPITQEFNADNPTEDVASVRVVQQNASSIRLSVTGNNAPPKTEVTLKAGGLAYSLNPEAEEPDEEIVVTGEGQRGYRVPNASTATKTDTPLRDIPQSIQVIPEQVLREQQVTRLADAIRNVSGVTVFNPPYYTTSALTIRGFNATGFVGNYLRNGIRERTVNNSPELTGIERLEILKGPASVLFGSGNPGGVVNLITKQPLRNPFYSVEATIGSYDYYRGAIDLTGPLNNPKTLLYRLNASYRNSSSFIDFFEEDNLVIAPVLSWAISDRTQLTLDGEYVNAATPFVFGVPAVGTVLPNPNGKIPLNRNVNERSATHDITSGRIGYRLEHKFSNNWSIRNAFQALFLNFDQNFFLPTSLAANNRTLNRLATIGQKGDYDFYDVITDVVGKFSTGSIGHQLVFGVDFSSENSAVLTNQGTARPLDLFNPVYNDTVGLLRRTNDTTSQTNRLGIYVQDQIMLAQNLKLLVGLRFDTFKQTNENLLANSETEQTGDAFSPRVGIVYQPIQPISLYASYSRSFNPVTGTTFGGSSFIPERGTQYEVGVKADLSDRLAATLAFYDITRSNVTTADPVNPTFSIQTGEQRSRGIELNLAGEVLPGWNIIAGYAYSDVRITRDNTFAVDNRVNNAPENSFNLWTTYEFQRGFLQGFGFGAGVFYVGERQGDLANTFQLPYYFRTDAAIFYKRDRFRAQVNFKNLFNVDYFEGSLNRLRLYPGEPFTVQGTISWQF